MTRLYLMMRLGGEGSLCLGHTPRKQHLVGTLLLGKPAQAYQPYPVLRVLDYDLSTTNNDMLD